MASASQLRIRRSAAQLYALAHVERDIKLADSLSRRKYLQDFNEAFQAYESPLRKPEFEQMLISSDVILIGDYHALPQSQRFAAEVLQFVAQRSARPLVLGLEMLFSHDQRTVDEWYRGEVSERQLRSRVRFDAEWGYLWQPFYELLLRAREHGIAIFALDRMPRGDLRRIAQRDRHAAEKIAGIHASMPQAAMIVLFGESHLAPQHLPGLVRDALPGYQVLTVLQNLDELYWRAISVPGEAPLGVKISADVVCVFTATPLEKYESYRHCIERWRHARAQEPDLAPSFFNLIKALFSFLNMERVLKNQTRPVNLFDFAPEICCRGTLSQLLRVLEHRRASGPEIRFAHERVHQAGCVYLQRLNLLLVLRYELAGASEEVTRFLHAATSGHIGAPQALDHAGEDGFYARCLMHALTYVGSRILYPAGDRWTEHSVYAKYLAASEDLDNETGLSYGEYLQLIDFVVMHKDFEVNARRYRTVPLLIVEGRSCTGERFELATQWLGKLLGAQVYEAFVSGRVHKRYLRSLLVHPIPSGEAAKARYFLMAHRTRRSRRELSA